MFRFLVQELAGYPVTPQSVFTTYSIINILRFVLLFVLLTRSRQPFFTIGMMFNFMSQVKVSLSRINDFILSSELASHPALYSSTSPANTKQALPSASSMTASLLRTPSVSTVELEPLPQSYSPKGVIELDNATFSWADSAVALSGISFSVNKGELVMIIGRVGSGKSALASVHC